MWSETYLHHLFVERQLGNKIEFSNGRHRVPMLNGLQLEFQTIIYDGCWRIAHSADSWNVSGVSLFRTNLSL